MNEITWKKRNRVTQLSYQGIEPYLKSDYRHPIELWIPTGNERDRLLVECDFRDRAKIVLDLSECPIVHFNSQKTRESLEFDESMGRLKMIRSGDWKLTLHYDILKLRVPHLKYRLRQRENNLKRIERYKEKILELENLVLKTGWEIQKRKICLEDIEFEKSQKEKSRVRS